jgi:hypothetical protein
LHIYTTYVGMPLCSKWKEKITSTKGTVKHLTRHLSALWKHGQMHDTCPILYTVAPVDYVKYTRKCYTKVVWEYRTIYGAITILQMIPNYGTKYTV